MFAHGDLDPRPIKPWTIRKLIPVCGCGLLSGQWGTYKSFMALEIGAATMTGQPFNTYVVQRQCGVLFLPAEGAGGCGCGSKHSCGKNGGCTRFRWFDSPMLLHPRRAGAMARLADASLRKEFGALGWCSSTRLRPAPALPCKAPKAMAQSDSRDAVLGRLPKAQLLVRHRSPAGSPGTRGSSSRRQRPTWS
jgi:hypothetical protein